MAAEVAKMDVLLSLNDQFSKGMKQASKGFKASSAQFKKAGMAITAMGAAGALAIKGWVDAANEQIRAETQLNAVLKATENAAGFTADEIKAMAGEMQSMTTIGDEAIISGQNMLLTFKNIGGDIFPRTTATLLDMATAMNNGATPSAEMLKAQAIQLGKALNDPIAGMASLSRVGVAFTDEQKETIKTLQESGDLMGAQAVILKELEGQFGGAAAAQAETFQGKMIQLKNSFGDFKEELGMAVMPILASFGEALGRVIEWFQNLSPRTKELIAKITLFGTGIALVLGPLLIFAGFLPAIATGLGMIVGAMGTILLPIAALIAGIIALKFAWENNLFGIQEKVAAAAVFVREKFDEFKSFIADLIENVKIKFEELRVVFQEFWENYGAIILGAIEIITTTIAVGMDLILAGVRIVWSLIKGAIKIAVDLITGIVKTAMQLLSGDWSGAWDTIKNTVISVWETIKETIGGIIEGIINFVQKLIDKIIRLINLLPFVNIGAKKFSAVNTSLAAAGSPLVGNIASKIPALAAGGIVTKPTLALIAENEPEKVIPLSKSDQGGNDRGSFTFINYGVISSEEQLIEMLEPVIRELGLDNRF